MKKMLAIFSGIVLAIGCVTLSVTAALQALMPNLLCAYYSANVGSFGSDQYSFAFGGVYLVAAAEILLGALVLAFCTIRENKK